MDGLRPDFPEKTEKIAGRSPLVLLARLEDLGGGAAFTLHSLSEIVGVGEWEETEVPPADLADGVRASIARSPWVVPGCLRKALASGGGRGTVELLCEMDRLVGGRDGLGPACDLPLSCTALSWPGLEGDDTISGRGRLGGLLSEPSALSPSA